ncbi:MAG: beta-propeller fold lactonase family protein [Candidatus Rokubacteria bacterium]|nr:beta-propeller fold lactonase family protein [Candidatus Rokubacteria bacterium]
MRGAWGILAVLLLAACNVAGPPLPAGPRPGEGRVSLYLNGPAAAPLEITFELTSIGALIDDGLPAPLRAAPRRIASLEVVERQILLAEAFLPQGRYRKLALGITKARVRQEGRWVDLSTPPEGVRIDTDFEIRRGEATALFMTWDVGRSIEREAFFRPAFALEGRGQELRRVLAYVSNEGSDTVSVIDRSLDRVVAVLAVGRAPRGLAVTRDTSRAFVVNSGESTLGVIDVNSNRVIHTTNLEVGAGASDAVITPDGRTLYVTNTALNSVSAIDAQSFQTVRAVPVGLRPAGLALIPPRAGLLVANGGSNTVSLIDTSRNAVAATIPVDFQPSNLAVDATGGQAFVPHLGSPRLSVVSLSALRSVRTVTVGVAAAVLPEGEVGGTRLLIARPREARVSLFDVGLNAEVDSIAVGEEPRYLALEPDREKLYVVNRGSDTVTVIDRFSRRVRATIQVGKRPYAIVLVP